MDHANDYNVDGGILSLGEFIFLELLSEMELPQDVRQFLILNKKTFQLILHPRFAKIIQSIIQITPLFVTKEAQQGSSDQNIFIHSDEWNDLCTIAIDPVIRKGIVRIEVLFENTGQWGKSIGVADASCSFAAGNGPSAGGNDKKTVRYWGQNGELDHITEDIIRNQRYEDGQRVAVEVDMTTVPRRATFFVEYIEQPNFVIGIPEAIRFWFERLIQQTAKGVEGSKALQWGKEWK
ncbi:MAG: hypothetical protein EZS28_028695 [Streblomastix strix]|uniref:Uncharacterized protein n=1 Tax=Streblomastix strix TaxID=222440 RepID=A0A5J4UZK0_9EUKA|nr:MAG: hypothetical protein EZS28_028695 [Streblomastix strix]